MIYLYFQNTLVSSIIYSKCEYEDGNIFKEEELIDIFKALV